MSKLTCPNKSHKDYIRLVGARGENMSAYLWNQFEGLVPESEYITEEVPQKQSSIEEDLLSTNYFVKRNGKVYFCTLQSLYCY